MKNKQKQKHLNHVINGSMMIKIGGSISASLIVVCFHYAIVDWRMNLLIVIFLSSLIIDRLYQLLGFMRVKCTRRDMIKSYVKKFSLLYLALLFVFSICMFLSFSSFNFLELVVYRAFLDAQVFKIPYLWAILLLMGIYLLDVGFTYFVSFAAFKNEYEIGSDTTAEEKKKIIKRLVLDSFIFKIVGTQFLILFFFSAFIYAFSLLNIELGLALLTVMSVFPAIVIWYRFTLKHAQKIILCDDDASTFRSSVKKTYGCLLVLQIGFVFCYNLMHGQHSHLPIFIASALYFLVYNMPRSILNRKNKSKENC